MHELNGMMNYLIARLGEEVVASGVDWMMEWPLLDRASPMSSFGD
jgi:hypothetical protein